jgi:hypothetical protein
MENLDDLKNKKPPSEYEFGGFELFAAASVAPAGLTI